MLNFHVISTVQTLLSNREELFLHSFLYFLKRQFSESFFKLSESEPHLWIILVLRVEHGDFLLNVAKEHVQVRRHKVFRRLLLNLVHELVVDAILRCKSKEGL